LGAGVLPGKAQGGECAKSSISIKKTAGKKSHALRAKVAGHAQITLLRKSRQKGGDKTSKKGRGPRAVRAHQFQNGEKKEKMIWLFGRMEAVKAGDGGKAAPSGKTAHRV